jgi:hypothetical protein
MTNLLQAFLDLGTALFEVFTAMLTVLIPWTPLAAWVAFWLLAVNWVKLRESLAKGGWIGLVLIGAITVLVWGSVAPGAGGNSFFGLSVGNFVEKTVYVSGLACIMFLAGALQLSGCCSEMCQFEEPILIAETHGQGGHGQGGHAQDTHGHAGHH